MLSLVAFIVVAIALTIVQKETTRDDFKKFYDEAGVQGSFVLFDQQKEEWYVGYVEKGDNAYYFANCIQSSKMESKTFGKDRIEITKKILPSLKIIEW